VGAVIGRPLGGRYELRQLLGRGGMARVYEAWDGVLGRRVAVKVLDERLTEEPTLVARFGREARAAAGLAHPNIVAVHDAGQDGPVPFIVMELVVGSALAERLSAGPLPPGEAAAVAADVCLALQHAHRRGVVHRDIKPGNILLGADGRVKVTDFGIAKVASLPGTTGGGTAPGTAEYLAPEQAWSERVDARADIYSLGCCLYEMLTGVPPFGTVGDRLDTEGAETGEHLTSVQIAVRHLLHPPVPPGELRDGIPDRLAEIVLRALAKRPADRQQGPEELRQDLLPFRRAPAQPAATAAAATTEELPRRATGPVVSRRVAIGGIGGLALLGAVAAAVALDPDGGRGAGTGAPGPTAEAAGTTGPPTSAAPATTGAPPATEPPATEAPSRAAEAAGRFEIVPDVVGLHQDDASATLSELGLGTAVQAVPTRRRDRLQRVLSQDPPAGTRVPRGQAIRVVVAQWLDADAGD
jgi:serine/threonine-protein kinase